MSKIFLIALLLATPLAAADGIDIDPPGTDECEWSWESDSGGDWWSSENYTSWSSWDESSSGYGCEYRDDRFEGGVSANGNEVVHVTSGSGGSYGDRYSQANEAWGYEWYGQDGYGYGGSGSYRYTASREDVSGSDTTVSTLLVDATYAEGCWTTESYSYEEAGSYRYDSTPYGTWSASSSSERSSSAYDEGCARSAAVSSGVTDVSAGRDDSCRGADASSTSSSSYTSDGGSHEETGASSSYASGCDAVFFANAGEERATLGSTSECRGSSSDDGTRSYTDDRCSERTGVFGPTALGVYLEDSRESSEYCGPSGDCEPYAYESRTLVVEHAYTGRRVWYLA